MPKQSSVIDVGIEEEIKDNIKKNMIMIHDTLLKSR